MSSSCISSNNISRHFRRPLRNIPLCSILLQIALYIPQGYNDPDMMRFAKIGLERLRSSLACRLRGFTLCRVMPWVAVLALGWVVYSR